MASSFSSQAGQWTTPFCSCSSAQARSMSPARRGSGATAAWSRYAHRRVTGNSLSLRSSQAIPSGGLQDGTDGRDRSRTADLGGRANRRLGASTAHRRADLAHDEQGKAAEHARGDVTVERPPLGLGARLLILGTRRRDRRSGPARADREQTNGVRVPRLRGIVHVP